MVTIETQSAQDLPLIENLLDNAFGADRKNKASYLLRAGVDPVAHLAFVARSGPSLVGTLRFWRAGLRDLSSGTVQPVLYLGPIAISPMVQGQGIGSRLLRHGIASAVASDLGPVFLVGSKSYYERYGFEDMGHRFISLPGGQDADRLQVYGAPEAFDLPDYGVIESWSDTCLSPVQAA